MAAANTAEQNLLLDIAESILSQTQSLISLLKEQKHPGLSFTEDSADPPATENYEKLRIGINTAALDLQRLVNGPRQTLRTELVRHYDLAAYQSAFNFDFFKSVPLRGHASLQELSEKSGLEPDRLQRIMRFLTTQRVFKEVSTSKEEPKFEHTATSALLVKEPLIHDVFAWQTDEMFQAASVTSAALRKTPSRSSFVERFGSRTYDWYQQHEDKAGRFARAMAGIKQLDRQATELYDEFDWDNLPSGVVVDIGGGSGHVSRDLAEKCKHLNFVVQDIGTAMLEEGATDWLGDLATRVKFMKHDFFEPQPITDACAYFTRQVIHNLTDAETIKFLKAIVPALEVCPKGTPLLINDLVLPEPGDKTAYEEYSLRQMDLLVMVCFNAKQRTANDIQKLLHEADPRLEELNESPQYRYDGFDRSSAWMMNRSGGIAVAGMAECLLLY